MKEDDMFSLSSDAMVASTPLKAKKINIGNLVTIDLETGEVKCQPGYTPDGAAQVFWNAIQANYKPLTQMFDLGEAIKNALEAFKSMDENKRQELIEQTRRSFVIDNVMLANPCITRRQMEQIYDAVKERMK